MIVQSPYEYNWIYRVSIRKIISIIFQINNVFSALTRIDVAGLILGFLIDGTETSSGVAGFMLYAVIDIQK